VRGDASADFSIAVSLAGVNPEAAWAIKESLPSLKEGDTITYAIEVADNHSGEGGAFRTRSQARRHKELRTRRQWWRAGRPRGISWPGGCV